jgi:hypothetical protein
MFISWKFCKRREEEEEREKPWFKPTTPISRERQHKPPLKPQRLSVLGGEGVSSQIVYSLSGPPRPTKKL